MGDLLLIIGNPRGMEPVCDGALARFPEHQHQVDSAAAIASQFDPRLVLVFQQHPDEYPRSQILGLIDRFPAARLVVCQGPWCASYGRTRDGWPPAVCVPWEQVIGRLDRELEVLAGRRPPLPLTAGLDEIFAFDHDL